VRFGMKSIYTRKSLVYDFEAEVGIEERDSDTGRGKKWGEELLRAEQIPK
jgi:hypothetical protein